ncbi:TPA: hypothetical protein QDB07_000811 [Burkholderia vietnamiensis]|uniref:LPD29 domain-containing protein n=1 Tax=Burkholderia glumae TaxID=337 RepID=UPI0021501230|nr:LPD29 domain-containing protein [Burkholderia glumae]HDR9033362.1 hypothetical protein [Burkholderia vietnamiensis]
MASAQQSRTTDANRAFPAPLAPRTASEQQGKTTPQRVETATSPAALANVLSLVETAQLVQQVLGESFCKTRFYVKTQQADTHTRIHVEWVDGPTEQQVSKILLPLQSATPGTFGGLTPVEHFRITPTGPQKLTLAADRITVKRGFSAGLITNVLQRLAHRHAGRIDPETRKLLTVEAFRKGALATVVLFGIHFAGNSLATDVETALHAHSDVQGFPRSATASAIFTRKPLKA